MSIERPASPLASGETLNVTESQPHSNWLHFPCDGLPGGETEAVQLLGGKGLSLCRLVHAGHSVPAAFTITTRASQYYYAHRRQLPDGLWDEVRAGVARLELQTGLTFGRGPQPLTLAARSGAAESMPGLMATVLHCGFSESLVRELDQEFAWQAFSEFLRNDSLLNIVGIKPDSVDLWTDSRPPRTICEEVLAAARASATGPIPDDPELLLRLAITAVFDSWEAPAAQRYRELRGCDSEVGTAVTLQVMFPAEVSGIVFSTNPAQPDREEFVVECILGLGRALVGGQVTPARWNVDRKTLSIRLVSMPTAWVENDVFKRFEQQGLLPLCQSITQIEELVQSSVDVEFGYAKGEVAFFQARSMAPSAPCLLQAISEHVRLIERDRLLELGKQGRTLWVRHNLAETLVAPTPLTWDLWRQFMSGQGGYGDLYRRLGYRPSTRACRDGFLELIAGRIYADPERLTEMICGAYPFRFNVVALRNDPGALDRPPDDLDFNQLAPSFLLQWPFIAFMLFRSRWIQRRLASRAATDFDDTLVPRLQAFVRVEREFDLARLSIPELRQVFERRRQRVFGEFAPQTLLPGILGVAAWSELEQRLVPILGGTECRALLQECLRKIAQPTVQRQRELLGKLARHQTSLELFLQEYGHHGPNEMDLSARRWREIPETIPVADDLAVKSPGVDEDIQSKQSAENLLRVALERNGARCVYRELSPLLHEAQRLIPYREAGKHEFLRAYELLRDVLAELSRRLDLGDGIHFLTLAELSADLKNVHINDLISERRERHFACQKLHVPAVLETTDDQTDFGLPPHCFRNGRGFLGTALSSGQATGRVFLATQGISWADLAADSIVVGTIIDPGMMPFIARAAGLVVEHGGILSHVALLARQLSIPAVVIPHITERVIQGEAIWVDADRGRIELPERSQ
ncbi:MAG: hypothetical protein JWM11_7879 [Planctomycetaceae bacterium]|nr:hypothetical protein [Planctomycetaceae bacterium]